ncbi:MAG: type II toxin-antitoxin system death-on-curing family toxin [Fimbriimonadaceae bacterium]
MTAFLTLVEVLAIHEDQIERYGGSQGVRDFGLIQAALYRPQTGYYKDVIQQAAALWESFSENPPFVDGNKRVGFAVAYVFLALNGLIITADPFSAYEEIIGWYERNEFNFVQVESWLRENTESADSK